MIGIYDLPEGYICEDCGAVLEPKDVCLSYDNVTYCRWCRSENVVPAFKCEICEDLIPEDMIAGCEHRVCHRCIDSRRYDLELAYEVGKSDRSEMDLNGWLASQFSVDEIEELLLEALKERTKIKQVDAGQYLMQNSGETADRMAEENA